MFWCCCSPWIGYAVDLAFLVSDAPPAVHGSVPLAGCTVSGFAVATIPCVLLLRLGESLISALDSNERYWLVPFWASILAEAGRMVQHAYGKLARLCSARATGSCRCLLGADNTIHQLELRHVHTFRSCFLPERFHDYHKSCVHKI